MRIVYGKEEQGIVPAGTEIRQEPTEDWQKILVDESDVLNLQKSFLLEDKYPLESIASIATAEGYKFLSRDKDHEVTEYPSGVIDVRERTDWIQKSMTAKEGIIREVGELIAVVEISKGKLKTFQKSALHRYTNIELFKRELKKTQLAKILAMAPPGVESVRIKEEEPKKTTVGLLKSLRNLFKTRILSAAEAANKPSVFTKHLKIEGQNWNKTDAHEGDTRTFGENDVRTLARTKEGMLRWMDADEYAKHQKELQDQGMSHAGEATNANSDFNKKIRESLKIGQRVIARGTEGRVAEKGDTLAVIQTDDGKREPIPLHEITIDEPTDREKQEEEGKKQSAKDQKDRAKKQLAEKKSREAPEYRAFKKQAEADGFTSATPYEYVAHQGLEIGDEKKSAVKNSEFRRIYDPDKKKWITTVDGKEAQVSISDGKYDLIGLSGDKIKVRDSQSGEIKDVHVLELDPYKGTLAMDEEGKLFVQKGEESHKIESSAISNEDLLKPGFIGVIQDRVFKAMKAGDAGVYHNAYVGKIGEHGVIEYTDENQMGIDGEQGKTRVGKEHFGRDYKPKSDEKDLQKKQKKVKKEQEAVKANAARVTDTSMAKSGMEALSTQPEKETLSTFNYQNTTDSYLGKNDEVMSSLAGKFGTSEWNASVDRLAQEMKAYDESKNSEMATLNAANPNGVKLIPRKIHTYDSYRDAAQRSLLDARTEYNRKRVAQKIKDQNAKFGWDETGDPVTDTELATPDQEMKLRDSKDSEYYTHYAFVPMKDVVASNNIEGTVNPEHPEELQARLRDQASSVLQMKNIKEHINDQAITDAADATRGAPVVFHKDGKFYMVQGNGRTGGIQATEGDQRETYNNLLKKKATELGKNPEKIQNGQMLVRVMSPKHTYEDARRLAAYGQESSAMPMTEVEKARQYSMGQREGFTFENINLEGIGARSIDETNVHNFIENNPELYKKIVKDGGYDRIAVESDPEFQARVVNVALLSQLNKDFLNEAAKLDKKNQVLVRRLAPALVVNQKQVAADELPKWANMQNVLGSVLRIYNNMDAHTKQMMTNRSGSVEFLSPDEHGGDPNTLLHRMRQEELGNVMGRDSQIFRDPLAMITLMAYHQAANNKLGEEKSGKMATAFALKVRRFQDALHQIAMDKQEDLFGATMTPEQREAEKDNKILEAAETTMLRNRTYAPDSQTLTPEEEQVGQEEILNNGVLEVMKKAKELYGIKWTTDKGQEVQKSFFRKWFKKRGVKEFDADKESVRQYYLSISKSIGNSISEETGDNVDMEPIKGGFRFTIKPKIQAQGLGEKIFEVGEPVADLNGRFLGKISEIADDEVKVTDDQGEEKTYKTTEVNPVVERK